ncbi:MAG: hypothetical protein V8Q17_08100 [Acutalibacteraceae bacterium]
MRSVQAKYNLDGTLDEIAYYAGIDGKNISGIEVRIFEENNTDIPDTPQTPSGHYKIIDAPFISQIRIIQLAVKVFLQSWHCSMLEMKFL